MTINKDVIKLRLHNLLGDDQLVEQYLKLHGAVLNPRFIAQLKNTSKPTEKKTVVVAQDEPVFEISLQCPVCEHDDIKANELRAKSQIVSFNKFLVPTYTGAPGFKTEEYLFHNVTVCPHCLFASPDKKDFIHTEALKEIRSQIISNAILTLQEKTGERKNLIKTASDFSIYFKRPREIDAAIDSYFLAMARAKIEEWYELPYASYKLGSYSLRIGHLKEQQKIDPLKIYEESLQHFEDAFKSSNCPQEEIEMQTIYLIVALAIRCGDQPKANSYLSVFSQLRNKRQEEMLKRPDLTFTTIDRWLDKARDLWTDRDEPDLFTRIH